MLKIINYLFLNNIKHLELNWMNYFIFLYFHNSNLIT